MARDVKYRTAVPEALVLQSATSGRCLEHQTIPAALAVSILDVKEAVDSETEVKTHRCFAHFLLDGHHKVFAAS